MKKITLYTVYCIVTGFLLSSCGTNMSLLKRHYTKGYYVEHSSGKHKASLIERQDIDLRNEIAGQLHSQSKHSNAPDNFTNIEPKEPVENPIVKYESYPDKKIAKIHGKVEKKRGITEKKFPERVYDKLVKDDSDTDKALSFMWVVIVIIFLLWLIGFLAGGFGLGNLIHLLLVVVLILLILWLLRII
jgi:hypothetical protein